MKHAIAELEIALHTAETNEPIHRAEGNIDQATITAERAADLRDAISVLKVIDGLRTVKPEPEQLHAPGDPAEWAPQPTTIRGWLETLPDGYRERALANMVASGRQGETEASDLAIAIAYAFNWASSPEGHEFWSTIRRGEGFPPLPEPA